MNIQDSINAKKLEFEQSFKEGNLYDMQTQNSEHINKIMETIQIKANQIVLDLGTGSGYLAFAMARVNLGAKIIGLDIVEKTLQRNREVATSEGLKNLHFVSYDGINLPFAQGMFDLIDTRYALYHFPYI